MKKKIDLHIHTNMSDGSLSPYEVIDEAVRNGVSVISIADHDTTEAYTDDLYNYANKRGVVLINGVEISTKILNAGIHVLGYDYDINNVEFKEKLFNLRNARHDYLFGVTKLLNGLGYVVDVDELDKIDAVTKAHIAGDVISNIKNRELLLKVFGHIPNKGEFIETIMNEGCPAYFKKNTISPKEAADLIRSASGKVILAHPVAYCYEDGLNSDDILKIVKDMGADGIEANYIYVDRNNRVIDDTGKWNEFACLHNLMVTVGSDFHVDDGIRPIIGDVSEKLDLSCEVMDNIVNNLID